MRGIAPSRPGEIGHALTLARPAAVEQPGERVPDPDAREQGQKRVLGGTVTDRFAALPVVALDLRVALACRAHKASAPVVGLAGRLRGVVRQVAGRLSSLADEALRRSPVT